MPRDPNFLLRFLLRFPLRPLFARPFSLRARCVVLAVVSWAVWTGPAFGQPVVASSYVIDLGAGATQYDTMGKVSAVGDFDGDGYDDLAVGSTVPVDDTFSGAVFVTFGGPGGLRTPTWLELSQAVGFGGTPCDAQEADDEFGASLAVGDFDGDGRDDLAVGAQWESYESGGSFYVSTGAVQVFEGRADRTFDPGRCLAPGFEGLPLAAASGMQFGAALAVGDFDDDGTDDLAIGAPSAEVDDMESGLVVVVYGTEATTLDPTTGQIWHPGVGGVPGDPEMFAEFGRTLATGDLISGDYRCDLAIGSPGANTVHVLFGCESFGLGVVDAIVWAPDDFTASIHAATSEMGASLAIGNFDCLGAEDLAIGAPGLKVGAAASAGEVWVVYGDQTSPTINDRFGRAEIDGTAQAYDDFGASLLATDLDGGCADLVVGEPGQSHTGFHVLSGELSDGLVVADAMRYDVSESPEQPLDGLAISLAAGRFDGLSMHTVVTAPRTDVGAAEIAGRFWILPGAELLHDGFETGDFSAWSGATGD